MLYLVGLGLSDETDITVKGLEVVKKASRVYLEAYTSILLVDQSVLVRVQQLTFTRVANADFSRNPTMDDLLRLPTVRWSSRTAMKFCETPRTRTWRSSSWEIHSGMLNKLDSTTV